MLLSSLQAVSVPQPNMQCLSTKTVELRINTEKLKMSFTPAYITLIPLDAIGRTTS